MHKIKLELYKYAELTSDQRLYMRGVNDAYKTLLKEVYMLHKKFPEYRVERFIELLEEILK